MCFRVQFMVQVTADPIRVPRPAGVRDQARPVAEGWPLLEEFLLAAMLAATLGVVCAAQYFPYHDATNNLARYVLMDRAWFGRPAAFVHVRLIPTPYIALDIVGVLLVHVLGAANGLRAMACLLAAVVPLGMYTVLRAVCPERRGWAVVGVLCSLTFYLLIGFFNFVGGIGVALFWLAAWWPRRDVTSWRSRAPLLVGLVGVFLVHLAGAMTVLTVLGIAYLLDLSARFGASWASGGGPRSADGLATRPSGLSALLTPRLVTVASAAAVVAVMSLVWHVALGPEPPMRSIPPDFRTISNKLANLASPFYSFSHSQMAVMGGGYVASLAAFLAVNRRTLRADVMLVSAVAFLVLFLVFPYRVGGAGFVDMRWLLPAIILPFCAAAPGPVPAQRRWLAIPCVATALHLGIVHRETAALDPALRAYRALLAQVPPDARLLPIVADREHHGRLDPFRHFALWHTIDAGGRVSGLLTEEERYDTNPPAVPHKFFGHFQEPRILYYPDERWGAQVPYPLDSLDWRRLAADYDYIVVAGSDPPARAAVSLHADLVAQRGEFALYAVKGESQGASAGGREGNSSLDRGAPPGIVRFVALSASDAPIGAASGRPPAVRLAAPGGFYTPAQIAYVTAKIHAHEQPWASAYDQLLASVGRVHTRQQHAMSMYNVPGYYQDRAGFFAATGGITGDADAAYVLALAYRLGDSPADADAAQRLLTAWARANTTVTGYDGQLSMAEVGVGFIIAAELLSDYPGWADADRAAFKQWVRTVYLAQAVNPIKDRKNNWGDWGTFGAVTAADYLGDSAGVAAEAARLEQHIDSSIAPDGRMPEETARGSGGIWYTYFALAPLTAAANVVRNAGGPNLFGPSTPYGARVGQALAYLFSALQNPQAWSFGANPKVPQPNETWGYDLFEAMGNEYGNAQWMAYAATRRPIMNPGHHYAWTFPTLMQAPVAGR
jgi:hypothetical protein